MGRTSSTNVILTPPEKTETKTIKPVKTRKRRANTNAIRQIRREQKRTSNIIPEAPFNRLVKEIAHKRNRDLRFKGRAYEAFHAAVEDFVIKIFSDANTCAIHSHRETVQPKDIQLAYWLQNGT